MSEVGGGRKSVLYLVSYFSQTLVVDDTLTVKFDIWDTAGQGRVLLCVFSLVERYRSINQLYYRGAAAAIVVFDLTQKVCTSFVIPTPSLHLML